MSITRFHVQTSPNNPMWFQSVNVNIRQCVTTLRYLEDVSPQTSSNSIGPHSVRGELAMALRNKHINKVSHPKVSRMNLTSKSINIILLSISSESCDASSPILIPHRKNLMI